MGLAAPSAQPPLTFAVSMLRLSEQPTVKALQGNPRAIRQFVTCLASYDTAGNAKKLGYYFINQKK
jgi:hypothetical protein